MQAYAQELLGAVIAEPLGEDPAALERMAVDGAEKAVGFSSTLQMLSTAGHLFWC